MCSPAHKPNFYGYEGWLLFQVGIPDIPFQNHKSIYKEVANILQNSFSKKRPFLSSYSVFQGATWVGQFKSIYHAFSDFRLNSVEQIIIAFGSCRLIWRALSWKDQESGAIAARCVLWLIIKMNQCGSLGTREDFKEPHSHTPLHLRG